MQSEQNPLISEAPDNNLMNRTDKGEEISIMDTDDLAKGTARDDQVDMQVSKTAESEAVDANNGMMVNMEAVKQVNNGKTDQEGIMLQPSTLRRSTRMINNENSSAKTVNLQNGSSNQVCFLLILFD